MMDKIPSHSLLQMNYILLIFYLLQVTICCNPIFLPTDSFTPHFLEHSFCLHLGLGVLEASALFGLLRFLGLPLQFDSF